MKFHGIPKATFYLHLKECEFRFNYRNPNIYQFILEMLRKIPSASLDPNYLTERLDNINPVAYAPSIAQAHMKHIEVIQA